MVHSLRAGLGPAATAAAEVADHDLDYRVEQYTEALQNRFRALQRLAEAA